MTAKTYVDYGFNRQQSIDPQIMRRDFWGACAVATAGASIGFATTWAGLAPVLPVSATALAFLRDVSTLSLSIQDLTTPLFMRGGGGLIVGATLAVLGFKEAFKPRNRLRHISGRKYQEGKESLKTAQKIAKQEIGNSTDIVQLSQSLAVAGERLASHLLIVGGVGSGKTVIAHHILKNIFDKNDKAIIFDFKGDFTSAYRASLYSPLDKRSRMWDVALDVRSEIDASAFASQIIAERKGGDSYFTNAGRSVLTALVIKVQRTKPLKWTFSDLYAEGTETLETIQDTVKTYLPHAYQNISEPGKQTQGVISSMIAEFDAIRILAQAEADNPKAKKISVRRFLTDEYQGCKQLILGASTEYESICRKYLSALFTVISNQIQSLPDSKTRKIWIVADEFPKLGQLDSLPPLITFGRSKGARVILLGQDIAQIEDIYGDKRSEALLSSIKTKIIGATATSKSAEKIAKTIIGMREVERLNITKQGGGGSSSSYSRDEVYVLPPSALETDLGKRGNGIQAILLGLNDTSNNQGYALNLTWEFATPKTIRRGFVLRDCFAGIDHDKTQKTEVKTEFLENKNAQNLSNQKETGQKNEATAEAVNAALIDVIAPDFGHALEALNLFDSLITNSAQGAPMLAHQSQSLKKSLEKTEELEV